MKLKPLEISCFLLPACLCCSALHLNAIGGFEKTSQLLGEACNTEGLTPAQTQAVQNDLATGKYISQATLDQALPLQTPPAPPSQSPPTPPTPPPPPAPSLTSGSGGSGLLSRTSLSSQKKTLPKQENQNLTTLETLQKEIVDTVNTSTFQRQLIFWKGYDSAQKSGEARNVTPDWLGLTSDFLSNLGTNDSPGLWLQTMQDFLSKNLAEDTKKQANNIKNFLGAIAAINDTYKQYQTALSTVNTSSNATPEQEDSFANTVDNGAQSERRIINSMNQIASSWDVLFPGWENTTPPTHASEGSSTVPAQTPSTHASEKKPDVPAKPDGLAQKRKKRKKKKNKELE